MKIECNANLWFDYTVDNITITIENNPHSEEVCRGDECGLPMGFSNRWTPLLFEWARLLNSGNGLARSSPQSQNIKEKIR